MYVSNHSCDFFFGQILTSWSPQRTQKHQLEVMKIGISSGQQLLLSSNVDEEFVTWNGSKNQLHSLFNMKCNRHHHPSIRIKTSIGSNIHFIDANLSHKNEILYTKVSLFKCHSEHINPQYSFCSIMF